MDFEVSGFCALRGRNGAPWNMLMTTDAAEEIVRPALSKRREGSVSVNTLYRVLAHPDLMREVGPVATALDGRAPATKLASTFAPTPARAVQKGCPFGPVSPPGVNHTIAQVGWRKVAMLRAVSRGVKAAVEDGEDGWQRLALVLAEEEALYVPLEIVRVGVTWKDLFWDHLFPARDKWRGGAAAPDQQACPVPRPAP